MRARHPRRATAVAVAIATSAGALLVAPATANAATGDFDPGLGVTAPLPVPDLGGASASQQKTLVIGIDGVRWDQVRLADTPNIQRILDGGDTAASYTFAPASGGGSFPLASTVSGPSWSSILTGVWPDKHGVTDNSFTGKDYVAYPDFLTRAERARPELTTLAAADWQPIAMDDSAGPIITDEIDSRYGSGVSGTGYLAEDAREADLVARTIFEKRTDISFIYMGAPDENTGGNVGSATYRSALEATDRNVGAMLRSIEESPSFANEDWRVVLVNDHGLTDGGGHGNGNSLPERTVYTSFFDPKADGGTARSDLKTVDIAPTVLDRAGIPIEDGWGFDGAPYQTLESDDFDTMRPNLRPSVDETQIPATTLGWTDQMPTGWRVDNSAMPAGGVTEWRGWVLTTNEFWASPSDDRNQGRENFVRGRDVIAVADSDAWDDLGLPKESRAFASTLITPGYQVAPGARVDLSYLTQYQQEAGQTAEVWIDWSTGDTERLKRYEETISGTESFQATAPAGADGFEVRFVYAGTNNWFWALDQVRVEVEELPDTTRPTTTLVTPSSAGPQQALSLRIDAEDDTGLRRIVGNIYQNGTLIKSTQTAANGAASATHTATITLPDGAYTLRYNSQDQAGNISTTRTFDFTIDATKPRITVKTGPNETIGTNGEYTLVSFKLFDTGKIDTATINGTIKDLTDNTWSDINFIRPGVFGATTGTNTLTVTDLAGNPTTIQFTLK